MTKTLLFCISAPLLLAQDPLIPVLYERVPDYRDAVSSTSRVVPLATHFGMEPVLDEMVRLEGVYEDDNGAQVSAPLDFLVFKDRTPLTRDNFLGYVDRDDYVGSIVHRSVAGFVIQGGGFTIIQGATGLSVGQVPTQQPVLNEFDISNTTGTISMAKSGGDPDSATSQWFVSLGQNSDNLDLQNGGFTVFGRISQSSFANARLLDPSTPGTPFRLANFGGALTSTPLHQSAFGNPTLTLGDFYIISGTSRVPVPPGEAGTSANLTYSVTPVVLTGETLSDKFTASIVGDQLQVDYLSPPAGETIRYKVTATDSVGNEVSDTFTISIANVEPYETWRALNFTVAQQADDAISGPLADANGDGRSNLQAFAQGRLPFYEITSDFESIVADPANNEFRLSFRYRTNLSGVRYALEGSDDLVTWKRISFQEGFPGAAPPTRQLIIAVNEQTRPSTFYRLVFLQE